MPKLSIIVPVLGQVESVEQTLVSVLENRPESCEVVLVLNQPYDDPYCLDGEVRFVSAPPAAGWVECANLGIRHSQSPLVHLLDCGIVVNEGWTARAVEHFNDSRIAAVSALIVNGKDPRRVISRGVDYRGSGRRVDDGRGKTLPTDDAPRPVLGANRAAAFYRKSAWEVLDGFDTSVGDALADIDFAIRLRHAGFRAVHEPRSRVSEQQPLAVSSGRFRSARASERFYWRSAPIAGRWGALAAHWAYVACELLINLPTGMAFPQFVGRLTAWCEMSTFRRHHSQLEQQRLQAVLTHSKPDTAGFAPLEGRPDGATEALPKPHLQGRGIRLEQGVRSLGT